VHCPHKAAHVFLISIDGARMPGAHSWCMPGSRGAGVQGCMPGSKSSSSCGVIVGGGGALAFLLGVGGRTRGLCRWLLDAKVMNDAMKGPLPTCAGWCTVALLNSLLRCQLVRGNWHHRL